MKLQITVNSKNITDSRMCDFFIGHTKCPIALAVEDIFPDIMTRIEWLIVVDRRLPDNNFAINLPEYVSKFIREFDKRDPIMRIKLNPISFIIIIAPELLAIMDEDQLKHKLKDHPSLQIIPDREEAYC
jgi:hypothetical protein